MPGGVPSLLSQAPGLFLTGSGPNGGDPGVTNVPPLNFWTTLNVVGATCLIMKNRLTVSVAQSGPHVPESPVVLGYGPKCIVAGSDERMVGSSVAKRSSICVWVSKSRIPNSPLPSPSGAADARPVATKVTNSVRTVSTSNLRIIVSPSFSLPVMQKRTGNFSFTKIACLHFFTALCHVTELGLVGVGLLVPDELSVDVDVV